MTTRRLLLVFVTLSMIATTALPATTAEPPVPPVTGMVITESMANFEQTWQMLFGAVDANPNINVVAVIDHATNAESVGLALEPNRELFFGNPAIGTPLMQLSPTIGIDLPIKMLVWQDRGRVFVGYNASDYLAARHDLGASPILDTIAGALRGLAGSASGQVVNDTRVHGLERFDQRPGFVTVASNSGAEETLKRLLAAIEASPANVAFIVDHTTNAASVGMALRPNTLVVFGNPNLGTPLMQAAASAGIDLPLKMLVWEDEGGTTYLTYTAMKFLNQRHHFQGQPQLLDTIATALERFVVAATGE